jgi:hypothetical protein
MDVCSKKTIIFRKSSNNIITYIGSISTFSIKSAETAYIYSSPLWQREVRGDFSIYFSMKFPSIPLFQKGGGSEAAVFPLTSPKKVV